MGKDDKRQLLQTSRAILLAIFVFLACAFASAIFAAYQRDRIDGFVTLLRSVSKPGHAVPLAPPRSAKKKRVLPSLILTERLARPQVVFRDANFSLAGTFATTDFCALLQPAFPDQKLGWVTNSFFTDTSDCIGELNASPATDGEMHNSLFIQIRRNVSGASTALRIKLTYLPARAEQNFKPEFERAADLVLNHLLQGDAVDALVSIRALRQFNSETRGINVKLFEELLIPGAFNLMIEARCGKYQCPAVNPYYKLNQPVADTPQTEPSPPEESNQQE